MLRIDELTTPPVVGKFYLVPTVRHDVNGRELDWPVMGPKHEDAEHLNFEHTHYHLDRRFLTRRQRDIMACRDGEGRYPQEVAIAARPISEYKGPFPAIVYRRLKCKRADIGFPNDFALSGSNGATFGRMHRHYAGKPCGHNAEGHLVCPHKGFVLGSLQPDEHGHVVCPLHGLRINVKAGVVLQFAEPQA